MISMDKKYKTRDGRDVRVLCVDMQSDECVAFTFFGDDGEEQVALCHNNGLYFSGGMINPLDLIEVKEKHVRWVNVYSDDYATKSLADTAYEMAVAQGYYGPKRIACIKIEFEEGEGL